MPAITVRDIHWALKDGLTTSRKSANSSAQEGGAREDAEEVLSVPDEIEGEGIADRHEAIEGLAARGERERVEIACIEAEMRERLIDAEDGARERRDAVEARLEDE